MGVDLILKLVTPTGQWVDDNKHLSGPIMLLPLSNSCRDTFVTDFTVKRQQKGNKMNRSNSLITKT